MGCLSQVAFIIEGEHVPVVWAEVTLKYPGIQADLPKELEYDFEKKQIRFHAKGVYWYDVYEEMQMAEYIWKCAKKRKENCAGSFVRIGENYDDTETRKFGDNTIWVGAHCSLVVPW